MFVMKRYHKIELKALGVNKVGIVQIKTSTSTCFVTTIVSGLGASLMQHSKAHGILNHNFWLIHN